MAKPFMLAPLPAIASGTLGTLQKGQASYVLNDYTGIVCKLACDFQGNRGIFQIDLGGDTMIDTVMVFGVADFPAAGTLRIWTEVNAVPGGWIQQAAVPPYAGQGGRSDGLGVALWVGSTPVAARYCHLDFVAPSTGSSVQISRVVIGRRFQPAIGFEYGAAFGVRELGSLDVSTRGVLLRHRGKKLRTVSLNFPSLERTDAEATVRDIMERFGNTECLALCTDPAADWERQNRCYYGPLVGDLTRIWRTARAHEFRLNLLGLM